ncbi:MAG: hypothetical protein WKF75_20695, partial [Singulisphaera sp.]
SWSDQDRGISLPEQGSEQDERRVLVMPNPDGGGSLLEQEEGDLSVHLIVRPHDMQRGTLPERINGSFEDHAHEGTLPEQTEGDQDDFGFEDS